MLGLLLVFICLTKLKVAFDDPGDGWVRLTVSAGSEAVVIIASYTPYDSFLDLVNALYNLFHYDGEAKVIWNAGPVEYELQFAKTGRLVSLAVLEFPDRRRGQHAGQASFIASGSYEDIAIPFWRALRNLQGRFTADDLNARWHRPFPWKEIDNLTLVLRTAF